MPVEHMFTDESRESTPLPHIRLCIRVCRYLLWSSSAQLQIDDAPVVICVCVGVCDGGIGVWVCNSVNVEMCVTPHRSSSPVVVVHLRRIYHHGIGGIPSTSSVCSLSTFRRVRVHHETIQLAKSTLGVQFYIFWMGNQQLDDACNAHGVAVCALPNGRPPSRFKELTQQGTQKACRHKYCNVIIGDKLVPLFQHIEQTARWMGMSGV